MKTKIEIEFPIQASPQLVYHYISTAEGLSEWFADDVIDQGQVYTFVWGDVEEPADYVSKKTDEKVKFRWLGKGDEERGYYFEIKIVKNEVTNTASLLITDFADDDEIEEQKKIWDNQISSLKRVIGSV